MVIAINIILVDVEAILAIGGLGGPVDLVLPALLKVVQGGHCFWTAEWVPNDVFVPMIIGSSDPTNCLTKFIQQQIVL